MNKKILLILDSLNNFRTGVKRCILKCVNYQSGKLERDLFKKENIPYFSLKGTTFKAKLTNINNVTDFDISIVYHKKLIKFPARLLNVKYNKTHPLNLGDIISSNQRVYLIVDDFDQDGKLLVTLYNNEKQYNLKDISINERILLQNSIDGHLDNLDSFFAIEL